MEIIGDGPNGPEDGKAPARCSSTLLRGQLSPSTPLVQDDELILNRHAGRFELANGAHDALGRQVTGWIVVLAHHQDARMMALSLLYQVVQNPEIIVVLMISESERLLRESRP